MEQPDVMMKISDKAFNELRTIVYNQFGINLTEQKKGLAVGRLQRLIKSQGMTSFEEYIGFLKNDHSGQALVDLVNRISTNYTYFYRESAHFNFLTDTVLPQVVNECRMTNTKDIRIWSAGCSSGEEPYGLIMLMMEFFGMEYNQWDAGVLATDISAKALKKAVTGQYVEEQVKMLPKSFLTKYFSKTPTGTWQVADKVKKEVTFRIFNLMTERFPFKKKFHAIFCRNVMIYFDNPTRDALVKRFYDMTIPGGYLFIGHSESLGRRNTEYNYVMPAVYRKV